jgi:hypothetical protein
MLAKLRVVFLSVFIMTALNLPSVQAGPGPEMKELMRSYVSVFDFFLYKMRIKLGEEFEGDRFKSFSGFDITYDYSRDIIRIRVDVSNLNEYIIEYLLGRTYKDFGGADPEKFTSDVKKNIEDLKIFALSDVYSRIKTSFNLEPLFLHSGYRAQGDEPETLKVKLMGRAEIVISQIVVKDTEMKKYITEKFYRTGLLERKWEYSETTKEVEKLVKGNGSRLRRNLNER